MANAALPVDQIPQCLRDREQWVCWKSIERNGKRTKKPIDAKTGLPASATDARTGSPFPTAYRAYRHNAGITGVG